MGLTGKLFKMYSIGIYMYGKYILKIFTYWQTNMTIGLKWLKQILSISTLKSSEKGIKGFTILFNAHSVNIS